MQIMDFSVQLDTLNLFPMFPTMPYCWHRDTSVCDIDLTADACNAPLFNALHYLATSRRGNRNGNVTRVIFVRTLPGYWPIKGDGVIWQGSTRKFARSNLTERHGSEFERTRRCFPGITNDHEDDLGGDYPSLQARVLTRGVGKASRPSTLRSQRKQRVIGGHQLLKMCCHVFEDGASHGELVSRAYTKRQRVQFRQISSNSRQVILTVGEDMQNDFLGALVRRDVCHNIGAMDEHLAQKAVGAPERVGARHGHAIEKR